MKTRNGYVSNSSSSSFVVVLKHGDGMASSVTDKQEALLKSFGFKYTNEYWKNAFDVMALDDKSSFNESDSVSMVYEVSCNQGEVEEFLFGNRIPFTESEEHDMRIIHYDGIHDWYERILNEGNRILMYCYNGNDALDEMMKRNARMNKPFARIRISDGKDITDETFRQEEE